MNSGMRVLSYLIAGVALYGFLGWLGDHLLGTASCCRSESCSAPPSGCYMIIRRFGRVEDPTQPADASPVSANRRATRKGHGEPCCSGADAAGDRRGEPEEGFQAPGVQSFDLPPLFPGVPWWLDKYMLQAIVAVILVIGLLAVMARKNKMVPEQGPVHRRDGLLLHPQLASPGT